MTTTPIDCPHCRKPARIRSSRVIAPTYRQLYCQCSNAVCGHTFAADAVTEYRVLYTIVPSMTPDPDVQLPTAPVRKRTTIAPIPANDPGPGGLEVPLPAAANDDDDLSESRRQSG